MWSRKELKTKAKKMMSHHYLQLIAVCFILAFVAGEYGDSLWTVRYYDNSKEVDTVENNSLIPAYDTRVIEELAGQLKEGKEKKEETAQDEEKNAAENSARETLYFTNPSGPKVIVPNSRGVFAKIYHNANTDGSLFFGVIHTLLPLMEKSEFLQILISMSGLAVTFCWWFFVQNILLVGEKRFFLEKINYTEISYRTLYMPIRVGKIMNTAAAMALKSLYQFLWNLTIAGGFIKHYSYLMVPYILAENPEVKPGTAIRMSKEMMKGEKWRTFLLDLTFAGWYLLGILTFGLLSIFFLNPYMTSAHALLYRELRAKAVREKLAGYENFNDEWLFEIPERMKRAPEGEYSYPIGYFPIPEHQHRVWLRNDFMRRYSLKSLILLFFTFSFIGWVWEVALHIVEDGVFVNRGVMYGPWLPIYGSGGVLILVLLQRVRRHPILTFFLTVAICGIVEYGTSWYLEVTKGTKWWDYSGYFLNLDGRICAEGLLVFGLGGCAFIYVLAPFFDELYQKIPAHRQLLICMMLIAAFAADSSYSHLYPNTGKGITDYASAQSVQEPDKRLAAAQKPDIPPVGQGMG